MPTWSDFPGAPTSTKVLISVKLNAIRLQDYLEGLGKTHSPGSYSEHAEEVCFGPQTEFHGSVGRKVIHLVESPGMTVKLYATVSKSGKTTKPIFRYVRKTVFAYGAITVSLIESIESSKRFTERPTKVKLGDHYHLELTSTVKDLPKLEEAIKWLLSLDGQVWCPTYILDRVPLDLRLCPQRQLGPYAPAGARINRRDLVDLVQSAKASLLPMGRRAAVVCDSLGTFLVRDLKHPRRGLIMIGPPSTGKGSGAIRGYFRVAMDYTDPASLTVYRPLAIGDFAELDQMVIGQISLYPPYQLRTSLGEADVLAIPPNPDGDVVIPRNGVVKGECELVVRKRAIFSFLLVPSTSPKGWSYFVVRDKMIQRLKIPGVPEVIVSTPWVSFTPVIHDCYYSMSAKQFISVAVRRDLSMPCTYEKVKELWGMIHSPKASSSNQTSWVLSTYNPIEAVAELFPKITLPAVPTTLPGRSGNGVLPQTVMMIGKGLAFSFPKLRRVYLLDTDPDAHLDYQDQLQDIIEANLVTSVPSGLAPKTRLGSPSDFLDIFGVEKVQVFSCIEILGQRNFSAASIDYQKTFDLIHEVGADQSNVIMVLPNMAKIRNTDPRLLAEVGIEVGPTGIVWKPSNTRIDSIFPPISTVVQGMADIGYLKNFEKDWVMDEFAVRFPRRIQILASLHTMLYFKS